MVNKVPNPGDLEPIEKASVDIGFEPQSWTAFDVAMIFIGTMNNRYGDFNTELENAAIRAALIEKHGEEQGTALFDLLNPRFTDNAPTTIPREDWSRPAFDSLAHTPASLQPPSEGLVADAQAIRAGFSNVYVLGRDKVEGGNAILVNGPQFGWFNPSYVYSIGLHGNGIDVVGNSPFGYPMIMFGHNATITWGSTWGASDIVDLYAESLNPADDGQYLYRGEYIDFEHRREVIEVKDGESVRHDIYRSVHGPVIRFDRDNGVAYAKKRAWDGGELDNLLSWLRATWAGDWDAWKTAAEKASINVNMYFADVSGNVGYFHGGHFPRRVAGHDNRLPASGDGNMDWQGRQDTDSANPHVLNPSSGFIANWNNKPGHGVMNPDFFFYSWSSADRVDYLNEALDAGQRFTPDEAWALLYSSSYADVFAPYFLDVIDRAAKAAGDEELAAANGILQAWDLQSRDADGDGYYDGAATAIFRTFIDALMERTLKDDLGGAYAFYAGSGYPTATTPTGAGTNLPAGVKAIVEAFDGDASFDLFNGDSADSVVAAALRDSLRVLSSRKGQAPDSLRLPVAARPFGTRNFLGIPQASDEERLVAPIEQNRGTENNMIIMAPGNIVGWEIAPPGQSGFVSPSGETTPHYDDQFELYHQFGRKRMWFYAADVEANKRSEIVLMY